MKKICSVLLVIVSAFLFSSCAKTADTFLFDNENYSMYIGQSTDVTYTIVPSDVNIKKIKWQSSNDDIATVNSQGKVTAISEGTCEIIAYIDKLSCKCTVSVIKETIFSELLPQDMLKLAFYELSDDGNCLIVDTNPFNAGSLMGTVAQRDLSIIKTLNQQLNLPDSLTEKMAQTRAIDGRLVEEIGDLKISWTYSPKSGIDATYEKIQLNN